MNRFSGPGFFVKMIVATVVCTLAMSAGVMLLWNWLIPDIFHGPEISYLQALGFLLLTKCLFGFKGNCGCRGNKFGQEGPRGYWRKRWEQKLAKMSPEEREIAKEKYKKCCGPWDKEDKA